MGRRQQQRPPGRGGRARQRQRQQVAAGSTASRPGLAAGADTADTTRQPTGNHLGHTARGGCDGGGGCGGRGWLGAGPCRWAAARALLRALSLRRAPPHPLQLFDTPVEEAARSLGIGETMFKRHCRMLGVDRWPHRKVESVDKLIKATKELRDGCSGDPHLQRSYGEQLEQLEECRCAAALGGLQLQGGALHQRRGGGLLCAAAAAGPVSMLLEAARLSSSSEPGAWAWPPCQR